MRELNALGFPNRGRTAKDRKYQDLSRSLILFSLQFFLKPKPPLHVFHLLLFLPQQQVIALLHYFSFILPFKFFIMHQFFQTFGATINGKPSQFPHSFLSVLSNIICSDTCRYSCVIASETRYTALHYTHVFFLLSHNLNMRFCSFPLNAS